MAYEYSNYGFAILGRIVTRASGKPYNEYIATHILRPLDMRSTTLSPGSVPADRLAHGYRWEDEQWKEEPQLPDGSFGAMGGMLTSLSDLGRYVAAYLGAWPPRDGPETGPVRRASLPRDAAGLAAIPADRGAGFQRALRVNTGGYGFGLRVGAGLQTSATWYRTAAGCRASGPGCSGCRRTASGSSRSATGRTPGWGRPVAAALAVLKPDAGGLDDPPRRCRRRRWWRRGSG